MSDDLPIGFGRAPVPADDRVILRDVALAYRRARRAGGMDIAARDAAMDRFFELWPEAARDRLASNAR